MDRKILVIDDSEHYQEVIKIRLQNYGYDKCFVSKLGKDGLKRIVTVEPTMVIISTQLPDMDGFELCKQIKETYGDKIKVILMAGMAETNHLQKAKDVKADDYTVKTFDCLLIIVAIKKIFAKIEIQP